MNLLLEVWLFSRILNQKGMNLLLVFFLSFFTNFRRERSDPSVRFLANLRPERNELVAEARLFREFET